MSCPQFAADSFAVRTAIHMAHLLTRSEPKHRALGDFYEALVDKVDAYVEVYLGLDNEIASFPRAQIPTGDPVSILAAYLDQVILEQVEDHKSEALANILAEIEELTARTLYKLKRFTEV